ncbi:MAG: hypothetical protein H9W82_12405 [Lactobacillus sp.]|nr:hypothetical protein [Lactobacillus sp.]
MAYTGKRKTSYIKQRKTYEKQCKNCGKSFLAKRENYELCSPDCFIADRNKRDKDKGYIWGLYRTTEPTKCKVCGAIENKSMIFKFNSNPKVRGYLCKDCFPKYKPLTREELLEEQRLLKEKNKLKYSKNGFKEKVKEYNKVKELYKDLTDKEIEFIEKDIDDNDTFETMLDKIYTNLKLIKKG